MSATTILGPARRLRWYEFVTYNIYWFALSMGSGALGPLITPLLIQRFVNPALINTYNGAQKAAGLAVAILVQPAAGLLSDRSTSRWGRRRPFIFVGALLTALCVAGLAAVRGFWSLLVIVLLMQFSSNIAHGALQGIIPDTVPEDQRGRASAAKGILDLAPTALVAVTLGPLIASGRIGLALAVLAALYVVMMLITVVSVHEVSLRDRPEGSVGALLLRTVWLLLGMALGAAAGLLAGGLVGGLVGLVVSSVAGRTWALLIGLATGGAIAVLVSIVVGVLAGVHLGTGDARRYPSFTWWVVSRLAYLAAGVSILGSALYYLQFVLHIPTGQAATVVARLQAVGGVFALSGSLLSGFLAERFDRRALTAITGVLAALGTLLILLASGVTLVLIGGCLLGLATGAWFTVNWALGTDLVPPQEAGRFLGISNLAGAGAGIVGSALVGPIADYLNGLQPGSGYRAMFAIYALCFLLSVVALAGVREPSAARAATAQTP
jgi:MFS family permease